ncbi:MAG TPA: hypothetical protein VKU38_06065 [Ktedonobacteraceae bacterium]|nr:hypothetical protein [Ktedonobacteraceae bacterium]
MKIRLRWPIFVILASLIIIAAISMNPLLQLSRSHAAHASGSASITLSPASAQPGTIVQVSGQNFVPNDTVDIYLNEINGPFLASAPADASGNLPATNFTVPDQNEGQSQIVAAQLQDNIVASAYLTINPIITLSSTILSPGETVTLTGKGLPYSYILELFLDSTNNNYFDSTGGGENNGDLTFPVTLPRTSITQGQHIIIAELLVYQNNQTINIPVTFVPRVYWLTGVPGMSTQLNGAGLNANEMVSVYWGTKTGQLLGTPTTDAYGDLSFPFTAPTGLAPGAYPVTVVRTNQKPSQIVSYFRVFPVTMISTPGIRGNQPVKVHLTGFLPEENVTFSWSANNGEVLGQWSMGLKGELDTKLYPGSAPVGSYTLTVVGDTSGLQISNPLNVGPGIETIGSVPGGTTYVNGAGFAAGETVNVYLQAPKHGVTVVTDATGAFSTTITLPRTYEKHLYIHAVSSNGLDHASTAVEYLPAIFYSESNVYYGQFDTFSISGYGANESVSIIWNYQHAGQFTLETVTTDSSGNFYGWASVPSTPNQSSITIAATGNTSKLVETVTVQNYATITINPTSGKAGAKIKIIGGSFGGDVSIALTLQNTMLPVKITSNTNGTFSATFTVPTVSGAGNLTLEAVDLTDNITASTAFDYVPALRVSPTIVKVGDTISIKGTQFGANDSITLNPCFNFNGVNVRTNFDGSFSTKMQVTGSPGTCKITAQDFITGLSVNATIVIES